MHDPSGAFHRPGTQAPTSPPAAHFRFTVLAIVWSSYLLAYVLRLSVAAVAPVLKDAFLLSNTEVGALIAAGAIVAIPMLAFGGWAVDRYGVRAALLAGIAVTGVCAAGVAAAATFAALFAVLALSGLSTGLLYPSALKAILLWFPAAERGTTIGFNQTAVNVAGALTAIALPPLAIAYGWRIGFVAISVFAAAAGGVVLALYADPTRDRGTQICAADGGGGSMAEAQPAQRLGAVVTSRQMLLAGCGSLLISGVEFAVIAHLVLYLSASWSYGVVAAGGMLALYQGAGAVAKPASGLFSDRCLAARRAPALTALSLLASIGCAVLATDAWGADWLLYIALVLVGIGAGGWAGLSGALSGELGGHWAGVSSGTVAACGNLGVAVGPPLFGILVDWTGAYRAAWWSLSAAACGAAVLFGMIHERQVCPRTHEVSGGVQT